MNAAQSSPLFEAWIADSKVVDTAGPMIVFHATDVPFQTFNLYPHFGTQAAAQKRANDRHFETPEFIGVYLKIEKPLIYADDGVANHHAFALEPARKAGIVTDQDFAEICDLIAKGRRDSHDQDEYNRLKWENTVSAVSTVVGRKGFDGFTYNNTQEGGVSWVPFRPDQIWWVNRSQPEP